MTEISKNTPYFLDIYVEHRAFLRLLNLACEWAKAANKTHFTFLGGTLDLELLGKNWLKPLDNAIYIFSALKGGLELREKCWEDLSKKDVRNVLQATKYLTKWGSDSAAGLKCLATLGVVFLSPYCRTLGLVKNSLAVVSGLIGLAFRVQHLHEIVNTPFEDLSSNEREQLRTEWLKDISMIITHVCSISLNLFGGLDVLYRNEIDPQDKIPDIVFTFWGTFAAFGTLVHTTVHHFCPSRPK